MHTPAKAPTGRVKSKLPTPPSPTFFLPQYLWPLSPLVVTSLCCLPQVSVYQVLEKSEPDAPGGKKLLAARLVSLQGSGWEVFAITQAVSAFPRLGFRWHRGGLRDGAFFLTHFNPSSLLGSNATWAPMQLALHALCSNVGGYGLWEGGKSPAKSPVGCSVLPQTSPATPQVIPVLASAAVSPVPQHRSSTAPSQGCQGSTWGWGMDRGRGGVPVHATALLTGRWVCWPGTAGGTPTLCLSQPVVPR